MKTKNYKIITALILCLSIFIGFLGNPMNTEAVDRNLQKKLRALEADVYYYMMIEFVDHYYFDKTFDKKKNKHISVKLSDDYKHQTVATMLSIKGKYEVTEAELKKTCSKYFDSTKGKIKIQSFIHDSFIQNGTKYYCIMSGDWGEDSIPIYKPDKIKKISSNTYDIISNQYLKSFIDDSKTFIGKTKIRVEKSSKGKYGYIIKKINFTFS